MIAKYTPFAPPGTSTSASRAPGTQPSQQPLQIPMLPASVQLELTPAVYAFLQAVRTPRTQPPTVSVSSAHMPLDTYTDMNSIIRALCLRSPQPARSLYSHVLRQLVTLSSRKLKNHPPHQNPVPLAAFTETVNNVTATETSIATSSSTAAHWRSQHICHTHPGAHSGPGSGRNPGSAPLTSTDP